MSIARISNLFMLGAFALSACVVSTNDGDGSGGRSGSGGATTGGVGGKAGSSGGSGQAGGDSDASAGAAGQAGLGGSAGEAGAGGSAGGGAAGQAGSAGAAGGGGAGASGGAAGASGAAGADSGVCDDSTGTHPDCSVVSPNCGLSVAKTSCEQAPNHFKPRVAQHVSTCIIGLSPDEQCNPAELYTCFDDALRAACDDASAGVSCTAIVAACPIIAAAQCRLYLSGMTASARASMTACMSSIVNGCNLPACIRAL